MARGISGVAPTIYLRAKAVVPATAAVADSRPKVYALQRFAKTQLAHADAAEKAVLEADIARYQSYLDGDLAPLYAEAEKDIQAKKDLIPLLDRYPEVSIGQLPEYADALQKKLDAAHDILSKDVAPPTDVDPAYFETSKFRVLDVYTGSIVSMPEGDLVPGAIECLPGQVIHTTVNGEDVMLEIDEIDEGYQVCWFKPDVTIPEGSEVLWSYPYEPTANTPTGTTWNTSEVAISEPVAEEVAVVSAPPAKTVANVYDAMATKLEQRSGADLQAQFKQALLRPSALLPLDSDYATTYDREVVESKRDRLLTALVEAETAPPLPYMPDVLQLQLEHNILKSQMVDYLRQQETYIAQQQLLARLHERRLAGEIISDWEALDYEPHVRDDSELATDFADPTTGRYIWKLFPELDGDEMCLMKDTRFDAPALEVDPLNLILAEHLKATPIHAKLEKKLFTEVTSKLA